MEIRSKNVKKENKGARQDVKCFHNNADLCYEIKHDRRFGEIE